MDKNPDSMVTDLRAYADAKPEGRTRVAKDIFEDLVEILGEKKSRNGLLEENKALRISLLPPRYEVAVILKEPRLREAGEEFECELLAHDGRDLFVFDNKSRLAVRKAMRNLQTKGSPRGMAGFDPLPEAKMIGFSADLRSIKETRDDFD